MFDDALWKSSDSPPVGVPFTLVTGVNPFAVVRPRDDAGERPRAGNGTPWARWGPLGRCTVGGRMRSVYPWPAKT